MATPRTGFARTDDGHEFPYLDAGGEKRLLARLPTPQDHKIRTLIPTWDQGVSAGTLPPVQFKDIKPFKHIRDDVPILDQDGKGACLPHAWTSATMISRAISGAAFTKLSPWFLYSLINGGWDAGSNAGDALQALTETGICPDSDVPYATIRPKGYNAAAMKAASRFKLRTAYKIEGFEQAVIAASLGYAITFDLHAGMGFDVDSDGICAYLRLGGNNHEVMAGEEYVTINGKPYIGGRNSWGEQWGVKGRCYWQPNHLDHSEETYAVAFTTDDPSDSNMPPVIA